MSLIIFTLIHIEISRVSYLNGCHLFPFYCNATTRKCKVTFVANVIFLLSRAELDCKYLVQ